MKFCKDCKHSKGNVENLASLRCDHEKNGVDHFDPVRHAVSGDGNVRATLAVNCGAMRGYESHPTLGVEMCGLDGKWWEPK